MVYHHWCTSQKDWRLFQNMNKYEGKNWQDWGGPINRPMHLFGIHGMLSFCHVNHDLCSLSNTYHISDFVHQLCWRLMGRTFCDLPADLQPGAKHDAKYDQLGNILFQKKSALSGSWSFYVTLCCSVLLWSMFSSCFPHVCLMGVPGVLPKSAKSLVLRNTCVCCLFDGGFQLLSTCHDCHSTPQHIPLLLLLW